MRMVLLRTSPWPLAGARSNIGLGKDPFIDTKQMRKTVSLEHGNAKNNPGELTEKSHYKKAMFTLPKETHGWIPDILSERSHTEKNMTYVFVWRSGKDKLQEHRSVLFPRGKGKGLTTEGPHGSLGMMGICVLTLMVAVVAWLSSRNCTLSKEDVCTLHLNLNFFKNLFLKKSWYVY